MANSFGIACPCCGEEDQIDIAADVWVRLVADGTDCDLSHDGSHEWGDDSPAKCIGCDWTGTAGDLVEV